jgi:hypothetical protein
MENGNLQRIENWILKALLLGLIVLHYIKLVIVEIKSIIDILNK